jgi:TIR domain
MVDIFISYAREDSERASKLAQAFGAMGWSVWWDRRIIVGQRYDQTIERELEAAKSVVVLWSEHSIGSEWVRSEAAVGAKRGVLVPAMLKGVQLPLEFSHKQTADLTGWNGDPSSSGFRALCEGVAAVLGGPTPGQRQQPTLARWHDRRWIWIGIGMVVLGLGYGVSRLAPRHPIREAESPSARQAHDVESGELADLVVGTYLGNITSDLRGSSRGDVLVTITRIDRTKVLVASDNQRIGTLEVDLTRIGDNLFNVGGGSTLIAYTKKNPPELTLTARGEVSYVGTKTERKSTTGAPR